VRVLEGERLQRTAEVVVKDEKGKDEKDKKSAADKNGFYVFDLPPGTYKVYATKDESGRKGEISVKVDAGKTVDKTIELSK
jgi:hypothetical protein